MSSVRIDNLPALSAEETRRYSRHLLLPEVGLEGQQRLKAARALCVGAGGLGSPAALYLAAAGVGTIGLVDFDTVDASNLQRQIIYGTPDVGRPKIEAAAERLRAINPNVAIEPHGARLTSGNALDILARYDVILDGSDNFATRYLVNDACVLLKKPNAYGSVFRFEGQASVFATPTGPCYRWLYPEPPPAGLIPSCAEAGVLGVLPGIIGTIQATEALKLILGVGEPLIGRFLIYDALRLRFRELKLARDPECPVCGTRPTIRELLDYDVVCGAGEGAEGDDQLFGARVPEVTATALKSMLERGEVFLLDVREPGEARICSIPGATLIPMGEVPRRLSELDPGRQTVVHCRSGVRSAKVVAFLSEQGFKNVRNMKGGILAWIDEVDPTQARY